MSRTKNLETIQKLLAKGSSTTNPNEAAAFLGKAQAMMAEAGITQHDVDRSQVTETLVKSRQSVSRPKDWESNLVQGVAKSFGCLVMWQAGHSDFQDYWGRYVIVGGKDHVKLAEYAIVSLMRQAAKARAERSKGIDAKYRKDKTKYLDSYVLGWVSTVVKEAQRFSSETSEQLKQFVQEYVDEKKSGNKTKGRKTQVSSREYFRGVEDASSIELQRPMSAGEALKQIGN